MSLRFLANYSGCYLLPLDGLMMKVARLLRGVLRRNFCL